MKRLILLSALLITLPANADLLNGGYVSPETYAVNEADLQDYRYAPPPPKLDIDTLDDMRFQAPNLVEKDIQVGSSSIAQEEEKFTKADKKSRKDKKLEKAQREELQPYQKKFTYKVAKWWVDQRYKREEPHHGSLHEIKVNKRIENENKEK